MTDLCVYVCVCVCVWCLWFMNLWSVKESHQEAIKSSEKNNLISLFFKNMFDCLSSFPTFLSWLICFLCHLEHKRNLGLACQVWSSREHTVLYSGAFNKMKCVILTGLNVSVAEVRRSARCKQQIGDLSRMKPVSQTICFLSQQPRLFQFHVYGRCRIQAEKIQTTAGCTIVIAHRLFFSDLFCESWKSWYITCACVVNHFCWIN